ncbi:MAG: hypothetical protein ABR595_06335 [Psychroflexus sp.]
MNSKQFMKNVFLIFSFIALVACSSDDDSASDDNGNGNGNGNGDGEFVFDFDADNEFGNAYISDEGTDSGITKYRLQIVPPGVTFDESSAVFTGGSQGDYVSFDFKVDSSEDFLVSGNYEFDFQTIPGTVDGVLFKDVTVQMGGADGNAIVVDTQDGNEIQLDITESQVSFTIEATALEASGGGSSEEWEVTGSYTTDYEVVSFE